MLDGYSVLAPVYDKLNDTVDYGKWAVFIRECFGKFIQTAICAYVIIW